MIVQVKPEPSSTDPPAPKRTKVTDAPAVSESPSRPQRKRSARSKASEPVDAIAAASPSKKTRSPPAPPEPSGESSSDSDDEDDGNDDNDDEASSAADREWRENHTFDESYEQSDDDGDTADTQYKSTSTPKSRRIDVASESLINHPYDPDAPDAIRAKQSIDAINQKCPILVRLDRIEKNYFFLAKATLRRFHAGRAGWVYIDFEWGVAGRVVSTKSLFSHFRKLLLTKTYDNISLSGADVYGALRGDVGWAGLSQVISSEVRRGEVAFDSESFVPLIRPNLSASQLDQLRLLDPEQRVKYVGPDTSLSFNNMANSVELLKKHLPTIITASSEPQNDSEYAIWYDVDICYDTGVLNPLWERQGVINEGFGKLSSILQRRPVVDRLRLVGSLRGGDHRWFQCGKLLPVDVRRGKELIHQDFKLVIPRDLPPQIMQRVKYYAAAIKSGQQLERPASGPAKKAWTRRNGPKVNAADDAADAEIELAHDADQLGGDAPDDGLDLNGSHTDLFPAHHGEESPRRTPAAPPFRSSPLPSPISSRRSSTVAAPPLSILPLPHDEGSLLLECNCGSESFNQLTFELLATQDHTCILTMGPPSQKISPHVFDGQSLQDVISIQCCPAHSSQDRHVCLPETAIRNCGSATIALLGYRYWAKSILQARLSLRHFLIHHSALATRSGDHQRRDVLTKAVEAAMTLSQDNPIEAQLLLLIPQLCAQDKVEVAARVLQLWESELEWRATHKFACSKCGSRFDKETMCVLCGVQCQLTPPVEKRAIRQAIMNSIGFDAVGKLFMLL
jgi:hypothetical protein